MLTAVELSMTEKKRVRNQLRLIMERMLSRCFRSWYSSGRCFSVSCSNTTTGREGGREGERERGREKGMKEGGREGGMEERGREEGRKEGEREGGREEDKERREK